jgi:hypothetical protein
LPDASSRTTALSRSVIGGRQRWHCASCAVTLHL